MRFLTVVAMLLILPCGALATPTEWPVSEGGNGHFYEAIIVSDFVLAWAQAHEAAISITHAGLSGHLCTIASAQEDDWVKQNLLAPIQDQVRQGQIVGSCNLYIGGWKEFAPDGSLNRPWRWITAEAWSYTGWRSGEPSDPRNELRLSYAIYRTEIGWNDIGDSYHNLNGKGYVVEYDDATLTDLPPGLPVGLESTTWGDVKSLFR